MTRACSYTDEFIRVFLAAVLIDSSVAYERDGFSYSLNYRYSITHVVEMLCLRLNLQGYARHQSVPNPAEALPRLSALLDAAYDFFPHEGTPTDSGLDVFTVTFYQGDHHATEMIETYAHKWKLLQFARHLAT